VSAVDHEAILQSDGSGNVLFILFIPTRDRDGGEIPDSAQWVVAAQRLLGRLFEGCTTMPPAEGIWLNPETGELIAERVFLIHSYTNPDTANSAKKIEEIAEFLHRMGRETNQGEIALVIGDVFHRIKQFSIPDDSRQS